MNNLDVAQEICDAANREHFGIEPEQADEIVDSSIEAQIRSDGERESARDRLEVARRGTPA